MGYLNSQKLNSILNLISFNSQIKLNFSKIILNSSIFCNQNSNQQLICSITSILMQTWKPVIFIVLKHFLQFVKLFFGRYHLLKLQLNHFYFYVSHIAHFNSFNSIVYFYMANYLTFQMSSVLWNYLKQMDKDILPSKSKEFKILQVLDFISNHWLLYQAFLDNFSP